MHQAGDLGKGSAECPLPLWRGQEIHALLRRTAALAGRSGQAASAAAAQQTFTSESQRGTKAEPGLYPLHPQKGRSAPRPCGSGKKYTHCHGALQRQRVRAARPPRQQRPSGPSPQGSREGLKQDPGFTPLHLQKGRSAPRPCGSGKKYKHCHGALQRQRVRAARPPRHQSLSGLLPQGVRE